MNTIRILLVDDQPNIRRGLRMRLELEPDITVVGEAADGASAIEMARLTGTDVVLMDVEMPVMDGIAAALELGKLAPGCAVVMLSLHDDEGTRARAKAAGAAAFVSKHQIDQVLMRAIRGAASGRLPAPG